MALYEKNKKPFSEKLFQNPTSEYRGTPFWAWNCQMTPEKNSMIIDALHDMGMGGGHIHSRTGMDNPYMGEEFMDLVKDANKKFSEKEMITWLYDEDRWPSGFGGGFVTENEEFRTKYLVFAPEEQKEGVKRETFSDSRRFIRSDKRTFLGKYQVLLKDGWLHDYKRIEENEPVDCGYEEWYAYMETTNTNPWFNNQAYVNTLDKKAIERFIEVTHEVYKRELGHEFGKSIPAIFTDEPQFARKTRLKYATDRMCVYLPYTDDLEETFKAQYGHSLLDALPELFWERKEEMVSQIRYEYHDHVCERFAEAFADTLGDWCKENDIMLTGHMMKEPTLKEQTYALGEAMRSYRSFQLPGIDMLCDRRELSTAKQAQSAAHQYGCPGVMSELYGVTNWDFDFRGHKLQGDWQAALGVTVRVPHLTWTSMAGEAKRDYPASIGYQSPWYKEYKYIEDYFARINTLMTRGKADVKIGVIHPIESYWLYWGSEENTGAICEEMEKNFDNLIKWLLYGTLDFDFISESLFPDLCCMNEISEGALKVGEMEYDTIVVPNCVTLRRSTFERLSAWKKQGGNVIFAGEVPSYIDAVLSDEVKQFAKKCTCIPFAKTKLLETLEDARTVEIRNSVGLQSDNLIYQMRKEGANRMFFLSHVNQMANRDLPMNEEYTITFKGTYQVTCYEPLDGTKKELAVTYKDGKTILKRSMYDHDSLLLYMTPISNVIEGNLNREEKDGIVEKKVDIPYVVPVTLSEPNVLVLDQAEFAFDDGEWMPREELLRIDNIFRNQLGYPLRMNDYAQPWVDRTEEKVEHTLSLRFCISSEVDVADTTLALENKTATVILNGKDVPIKECGWYVDRDIICTKLGNIKKGQNELIVKIPYQRKENVENIFILGDFGVKVYGAEAVITEPVRELAFGDYTVQGLPFYGGNVTYHIPISVSEDSNLKVHANRFRNPLLKMSVDKGESKVIAFAPYTEEVACKAGEHTLHFTAYGNRVNTFGALHNCKHIGVYMSPSAWRTKGDTWSYEYQLTPTGILKTPEITVYK